MQKVFTDMLGREVTISYPPKRIVSVVPSQTELLHHLGLAEEVVGITKFCVHPEAWFRSKTRVGGTKQLNIEKIKELQPDLVIANKEENTQEQIEELAALFPVWVSDIQNIPQALQMIQVVGRLVGKDAAADELVEQVVAAFNNLQKVGDRKVAYFIWYRPWMSVGRDTFISHMLSAMGWQNVFTGRSRYPEITLEELKEAKPDLVLLSSEPFPFKEQHIAEVKAVLPDAQVALVDGEMFSWYGSRLQLAVPYLYNLMNTL